MAEVISNTSSPYLSVREIILNSAIHGKTNGPLSVPITFKSTTRGRSAMSESEASSTRTEHQISTATIYLRSNKIRRRLSVSSISQRNDETSQVTSASIYSSPIHHHPDDIGLEVIELKEISKPNDASHESIHLVPSTIADYRDDNDRKRSSNSYPPTPTRPPPPPPPLPPILVLPNPEEERDSPRKRTLPISTFLLEITALVMVFILSMILVLAIREEQVNLRTTMQVVYTYIYLISIIWMIWCIYDILKFRRQWVTLTSSAHDQYEYMDIVAHHPQNVFYFPDIHNTGGLFMRVGAGLLCMGSLLLTLIELAKTIEIMRTDSTDHAKHIPNYPRTVFIAKSITYIFRFFFHCVQFTFLFRYGNIIIDRNHFLAKIGLIHIVIANFCTWFEAIVIETVEQIHKQSTESATLTVTQMTTRKLVELTTMPDVSLETIDFLRAIPSAEPSSNHTITDALVLIEKIQSTMSAYLYPCLIEYSLISVTVFYIMWRNVGKTKNRPFAHFGDRHIFTINCSRASGGLLIGGIILLLTVLALVPDYILEPSVAIPITHSTELVLLVVSLSVVCISFLYTTKLYYDRQAHVDIFDQILILVTTVGDFAYSLFGLFASIFIENYTIRMPRSVEILIGLLALSETFFQSAFILDALKRRATTKKEIRTKPGRELITALLLINLAIWMHDSLSAKKVKVNPLQTEYYDTGTWAIVQAFTSPLSIFYRFHSSVCLADIWQEIYHDDGNHQSHSTRTTSNNSSK